ncbi:MAG: DUF4279 domain-containing protein [Acidobacteria bacterium]|nr:DUF4279 domain-containing protein [Acidobacteriota bacterium]
MIELAVALILRTASGRLSDVTAALGIRPSRGVSRGDVPHGARRKHFQGPHEQTSWILDSGERADASVNEHLRSLATMLLPTQLRQLRSELPADLQIELDIAVFYDGQAGHVEIDAASLEIVHEYGATLIFTAYYGEDEGEKGVRLRHVAT